MTSTQTILKGARALFGVAILPIGHPVQPTSTIVQQSTPLVRGTAFAVRESRFLTASHVLPKALTNFNGILLLGMVHLNSPPALVRVTSLVARDETLDFALLEGSLAQGYMEPLEIDFRDPATGEDVIAVGFPLPEERGAVEDREVNLVLRATKGIVASRYTDGSRFEIDAQFLPGLSGAPVLAAESAKVIGMAQGFRSFQAPAGGMMSAVLGISLSLNALASRRAELGL